MESKVIDLWAAAQTLPQGTTRPTRTAPPLADVSEQWLADLELAGRAVWTLKKHRQELARYQAWLDKQQLTWAAVTDDEVQAFARTRIGLSASARGGTMTSLRLFYAWAVDHHHLPASPAANLITPQRPHPEPKALKRALIRQIVAYLATQEGIMARRDEALVLTAIYTGLRASELAQLRWSQVDLDEGTITIYLSKWNHGRIVPIHIELKIILVRWQQLQDLGPNAPVFARLDKRGRGEAMQSARVGKIVKTVEEATGIDFTPHILRHSFATWTLKRSKDLYAVSKALGHRGVKQTEIYLSADVEDIADAVGKLPGINDW